MDFASNRFKALNKGLVLFFMFGSLFLLTATKVMAHSPVLWCYVEDGLVHVEAFFMGGAKIQNGTIYVVDKNGNKLLEGKTDKNGLFEFKPPVKDDMTIVLRLDAGHSAEFELTKQDFIDAEKEQQQEKK
ncbi:MAG: carboxypeptidase regulatory-like domain-containing protein [Thermodesulfobacteria bacterium]|nr:carboxypeptidase regulatory-like domain-containing protein [Thermodesulfobacteriota bacterium]